MGKITKGLWMAGIISVAAAGAALAQPPADIAAQIAALGRVVDPPGTAKIYAPLQTTMPVAGIKARRDVAYGAGEKEDLDVFTPETAGAPRPISGWSGGPAAGFHSATSKVFSVSKPVRISSRFSRSLT
jgi:hypothetical protein